VNTQQTRSRTSWFPFVALFGLLTLTISLFQAQWIQWGANPQVLHSANTILFAVTASTFWFMNRQFRQPGGQALLKGLYGSFMIRFFLIALAAFVYILIQRKQVNVPGLIGGGIFYVLYLGLEIRQLQRMLKSDSRHA